MTTFAVTCTRAGTVPGRRSASIRHTRAGDSSMWLICGSGWRSRVVKRKVPNMKAVIKSFGCRVVAPLSLPRLVHRMLLWDQLTIVMYHAVVRRPLKLRHPCFIDESLFHGQMSYLKRHFDVIPLSAA